MLKIRDQNNLNLYRPEYKISDVMGATGTAAPNRLRLHPEIHIDPMSPECNSVGGWQTDCNESSDNRYIIIYGI